MSGRVTFHGDRSTNPFQDLLSPNPEIRDVRETENRKYSTLL